MPTALTSCACWRCAASASASAADACLPPVPTETAPEAAQPHKFRFAGLAPAPSPSPSRPLPLPRESLPPLVTALPLTPPPGQSSLPPVHSTPSLPPSPPISFLSPSIPPPSPAPTPHTLSLSSSLLVVTRRHCRCSAAAGVRVRCRPSTFLCVSFCLLSPSGSRSGRRTGSSSPSGRSAAGTQQPRIVGQPSPATNRPPRWRLRLLPLNCAACHK